MVSDMVPGLILIGLVFLVGPGLFIGAERIQLLRAERDYYRRAYEMTQHPTAVSRMHLRRVK